MDTQTILSFLHSLSIFLQHSNYDARNIDFGSLFLQNDSRTLPKVLTASYPEFTERYASRKDNKTTPHCEPIFCFVFFSLCAVIVRCLLFFLFEPATYCLHLYLCACVHQRYLFTATPNPITLVVELAMTSYASI